MNSLRQTFQVLQQRLNWGFDNQSIEDSSQLKWIPTLTPFSHWNWPETACLITQFVIFKIVALLYASMLKIAVSVCPPFGHQRSKPLWPILHIHSHSALISQKMLNRIKWWSNCIFFTKGQWTTSLWHLDVFWPLFNTVSQEQSGRLWSYLTFGQTLNWWHLSLVSTLSLCWLYRSAVLPGRTMIVAAQCDQAL